VRQFIAAFDAGKYGDCLSSSMRDSDEGTQTRATKESGDESPQSKRINARTP